MYRIVEGQLQVLLVHPGGPFWRKKDEGAWSIPKGETAQGEDILATAKREFEEETGLHAEAPFIELSPIRQRSGKIVHAWGFKGDCDPEQCHSNMFSMEWPAKSGRFIKVPEADRAEFFGVAEAKRKINPSQAPLIDELGKILKLI